MNLPPTYNGKRRIRQRLNMPDDPVCMMLRLCSLLAVQVSENSVDGLPVAPLDILDDIAWRLKEGFVSDVAQAAELEGRE